MNVSKNTPVSEESLISDYTWEDIVSMVLDIKDEIQKLLWLNQGNKAIKSAINLWEIYLRVHLDDLPKKILLPEDKDYWLYKCRASFSSIYVIV